MSKERMGAIYARVSTGEQEQGTSLATQTAACLERAERDGIEVPPDLVFSETYSGAELWDRPVLNHVRELAKRGQFGVLYCYCTDRLSREPVHLLILVEEFEHFGIDVRFVLESFENSPEGKLVQHVRGYAGLVERERIRERTLRGKRAKLASGRLVGGRSLYGYRLTAEGKREIVEEQAAVVRRIFNWAAEGRPILAIARALTADGIPSPSGQPRWSKSTIATILHEEACVGRTYAWKKQRAGRRSSTRRPRDQWIALPEGTTPAIVDVATWEAVQEKLKRNKEFSERRTLRPEAYLLRGYVYCVHCGGRMTGECQPRPKGRTELRYRCRGIAARVSSTCRRGSGLPAISCAELDGWVWGQIESLLSDPKLIARELGRARGPDPLAGRLENLDELIKQKRKAEHNLLSALEQVNGDAGLRSDLIERLRKARAARLGLEEERDRLVSQKASVEEARKHVDDLITWCKKVKKRLGRFTFAEKRLALEALGARVYVRRKGDGPRAELTLQIPVTGDDLVSSTSRCAAAPLDR